MPGTDKLFRYWLGTFGSCVQTPARGDAGEPEVRCVSGGDYGGMGATLRPFEECVLLDKSGCCFMPMIFCVCGRQGIRAKDGG